jgi:oligopeptide transport system ATP-binding protein
MREGCFGMKTDHDTIVAVEGLVKNFPFKSGIFSRKSGSVKAVAGVTLSIRRGETFALVGESGCGKSTLGRCMLRLLDPTAGKVIFSGRDITELPAAELRGLRRKMQIIFQDPYASLNPRMTVEQILREPLDIHGIRAPGAERAQRVAELLDIVGLRRESLSRYPHEFSGGQRQRICIARALAVDPEFIVCDEPVSALDVSIQAQIINLLEDLQKEFGLTYLFISHDMHLVRHVADRVAVMYLGKIVESAEAQELYSAPKHHYTKALLSAIPQMDPERRRKRIVLRGDVPSPIDPPSGCYFHPRCSASQNVCATVVPALCSLQGAEKTHEIACHYPLV